MDRGIVRHLYVFNTDRLSRNQVTWYSIRQKMVKNSVTLYTPKGVHDTQDSMENMILGILSEISQYDNSIRSERSRLGKLEKVKQNYWRGGPPTFGYMIQKESKGSRLVENPEESFWVKYIFNTYIKKVPLSVIRQHLESSKILTRRGNSHWSLGSLQLMIRNKTYLGVDTYTDKKTGETIRNTIPQLISNHAFQEAQRIRKNKLLRSNFTSTNTRKELLRSYLICNGCKVLMSSRDNNTDSEPMYYCTLSERRFNNNNLHVKECHVKKSINVSDTDEQVTKVILSTLIQSKHIKKMLHEDNIIRTGSDAESISTYKLSKESSLNKLTEEQANIESALTKLESKHLLGELATANIYHNTKKTLLSKLNSNLLEQEELSAELEGLSGPEKLLSWLDRCAELVKSNGYEKKEDIPKPPTEIGCIVGESQVGREIAGVATHYSGVPKTKLKALVSNVLDSIHIDYDHNENLHHLDIKLRLPITKDPNSIFDKSGRIGIKYSTKNESSHQPPNLYKGVETYSTVMDDTKANSKADTYNEEVVLELHITYLSANLWESSYSDYQQFLFNTIHKQFQEGSTYKEIAQWFTSNGYNSPRGYELKDTHVWSIYNKKLKSIERFSRRFEPVLKSVKLKIL